jgi:hypothetical protein
MAWFFRRADQAGSHAVARRGHRLVRALAAGQPFDAAALHGLARLRQLGEMVDYILSQRLRTRIAAP